jgi:type III restriction enzyme
VKPFVLVVARDTTHAAELVRLMEEETFFDGRYRGRVITVHSSLRGEEKDENVEQLMTVEHAENPIEVVVHVNMLKEGWDVTNLYTIVPLRAADSRTLVEQSIGRGLRLPYGKRTGVSAVDRLTIVAHDRFQEIVDEANRPESAIRMQTIYLPADGKVERKETRVVRPLIETIVSGGTANGAPGEEPARQGEIAFPTPLEQQVARATLEAVRGYEHLRRSADLKRPEVRERLVAHVRAAVTPQQGELGGVTEAPDVAAIVERTVERLVELTIDIPRIVLQPTGEVMVGFHDFKLDLSGVRYAPVAQGLLIQHLRTNERLTLRSDGGVAAEADPRNYVVRELMDFHDISYDDHADLLYGLAGQVVEHLRFYLADDVDVENVLQFYQRQLAHLIHTQMQAHRWQKAADFEVTVSRGVTTLRTNAYTTPAGVGVRDVRTPVDEPKYIRGMVFGGFRRCLYPEQKFDSDAERRLAVVLEDDPQVVKWFKPGRSDFSIFYGHDQAYEPDFVVETATAKYLCEPKRADQIDTPEVQAKARAAVDWCRHATRHEQEHGGKPWTYVLIPHDAVRASSTLAGLVAAHAVR